MSADFQVRGSIRLSLLFYAVAVLLLMRGANRPARLAWTFAWLIYLVHVALAFHHVHHWSHIEAMEHVRLASGVGEGLYASYLFTLLWTIDVVWWWRSPEAYSRRSLWLSAGVHGFMLFMIFNATVIFEMGAIRWAGVALIEILLRQWMFRAGRAASGG
jgi:hypothetical protein